MSRKMKDSGIEWLGIVPVSWDVDRIKRAVFSVKGGIWGEDAKGDENDISCVRIADFDRNNYRIKDKELTLRNVPKNKQGPFILKRGDLIIEKSGGGENTPVGFVTLYDKNQPAVYSNFTAKIEVNRNDIEPNFIKFVFAALYSLGIVNRSIKQTTGLQNINMTAYLEERMGFPIKPEQAKIAYFLDSTITQIDSIIQRTKETINDYKSLKQSIITEAVTKGLNKDVEMKDSEIEWIGEIPNDWDIKKLKYLFRIKKDIAGEEGHDILSVTQSGLKIKDISSNEGQIAADYSKYQFVQKGDFVMNHMDLLTGWVDYSQFDGVTSPDYRVFQLQRPDDHSPQYYNYIFQSCYKNKIFYGMGQGVSNLGRWRLQTDKFINFELPVPDKLEQLEIARFLDKRCSEIDSLITQKQKLIEDMEAYKKSLIYECVTGKKEII